MSTKMQRDAVHAARAAAGATYAAAANALTDAYVELLALDTVCSSSHMSEHPPHYPAQPLSFPSSAGDSLFPPHYQFAASVPLGGDLKQRVEERVQAIFSDELG